MKYLFSLMISALLWLCSTQAWAGPYLNTSAMLLHENSFASRWVRGNLGDKQLAENAHKMARARVDVASNMNVPPEVREAHPHLLLALAAMERAMEAAAQGQVSNFIRQIQTSSGEATTFKTVLKGLGFSLPDVRQTSLVAPKEPPVIRLALFRPTFGSTQPTGSGRWLRARGLAYDPSWLALELNRSSR
jgi:hypothetical protein